MGITACYARVSAEDLQKVRGDPDYYWDLAEMPWDLSDKVGPAGSERLYIDKDWEVLSWLCSPLGKAEARHMAGLVRADKDLLPDKDAFKASLAKEVEKLGFTYVDPKTLAIDPILIAIQGRRDQDESSIITDLGLGACAFKPEEVKALFSALHTINEGDLRKRFDIKEIVALGLPGDGENSELDEFYLPQLNRIRTLYERAADAGRYVVVAMS